MGLYEEALKVMPGGVNSPVRSMAAIGRDPIFIERGKGAELIDTEGNHYVDWVCSWGPLIAGHAHPDVVEAVRRAAERGTSYGAPTAAEIELAECLDPEQEKSLRNALAELDQRAFDSCDIGLKKISLCYDPTRTSKKELLQLIKQAGGTPEHIESEGSPLL